MFGRCHWWAIPNDHPWHSQIREIQRALSAHQHTPHITIRTDAPQSYVPPPRPNQLSCTAIVTQTSSVCLRGTLWALEIPIDGMVRLDGEEAHLSVAYKWSEVPFNQSEINTASGLAQVMASHYCKRFDHLVWLCNGNPSTWLDGAIHDCEKHPIMITSVDVCKDTVAMIDEAPMDHCYDSREWNYFCEGNKHVLLRYTGSDDSKRKYLLRLCKAGKESVASCSDDGVGGAVNDLLDKDFAGAFNQKVNFGCLYNAQYAPLEHWVHVHLSFVVEMEESIRNQRCQSRTYTALHTEEPIVGHLVEDMCAFFSHSVAQRTGREGDHSTHTFELKVKSGLCSTSPFLVDERLVKRRCSRFHLIQLQKFLKHYNAKGKDYTGNDNGNEASCTDDDRNPDASHDDQKVMREYRAVSQYDPYQLCTATTVGEIQRQVDNLLLHPKNNLRISIDGTSISVSEYKERYDATVSTSSLLSSILHAERTLLQSLLVVQRFELLDIEGAALVYARLCALVGDGNDGDHRDKAQRAMVKAVMDGKHLEVYTLLRTYFTNSFNGEDYGDGERKLPGCILDLLHLHGEVDALRTVREDESGCTEAVCHARAMEYLQQLDCEECVLLLNVWLLGMAAKDASVMVSVMMNSDGQGEETLDGDTHSDGRGVSNFMTLCGCHYRYSICLIDIDYKHPSKCSEKSHDEELLFETIGDFLSLL
jgi:hypothetical protein